MIAKLVLYLLCGLLIFASAIDVARLRIPNWVVAVIAALFLPYAFASQMSLTLLLWHVAAGAAVLVLGFILFAAGLRIGGGDAKLFAALALWCGFEDLLRFFVLMCFAGGIVALLVLVLRRPALAGWLAARGFKLTSLEPQPGAQLVPYAPAMAAGFILLTFLPAQ